MKQHSGVFQSIHYFEGMTAPTFADYIQMGGLFNPGTSQRTMFTVHLSLAEELDPW
jgi:hypothetical protein